MRLSFISLLFLCGYLPTFGSAGHGYYYPKPARQPGQNLNETGPPAGVQADFIDDLIEDHKQSILENVLGSSSNSGDPGNSIIIPNDSSKAFVINRCANCACGVPNINRIVGGRKVQTNKYPWVAQILRGKNLFCGGSLINDRYVLTAAHCVYKMDLSDVSVRLLQLDRSSKNPGIQRAVAYAQMHALYSPTTLVNDIALLRLASPVFLVDTIRPVCLPSAPNQNFDFQKAIVAGWGLTREGGSISTVLQEVIVPVITNAQCRATSYKSMIVDTMLCAGNVQQGGKDACQGDSGGPLVVFNRIFRQAGVVSYGYGCAKPNAPGVYTRVSRYLDWIGANTRDACYCVA